MVPAKELKNSGTGESQMAEKKLKIAALDLRCHRVLYIKCLNESTKQYSVVYYVPEKRKIVAANFQPKNDVESNELSQIMDRIQRRHPKKRMFVFVNPSSGQKQGLQVFNKTVCPHLTAAAIEVEFAVTEKTGSQSLEEIAGRLEMASYDALVILGGDTSLTDILNSIWEKSGKADLKECSLPCFGLIPVGTGNGLAKDWYGSDSIDAALAGIILGETKRTILTRISSASGSFDRLAGICVTYGWAVDVGCSMQKKLRVSVSEDCCMF